MTAKERMLRALTGKAVQPPPVVFHSWGDYKVEFAGFHPKLQYYQGGGELAGVERAFYERFRPDWIHCGSAGWRGYWHRPRRVDGNRAYLRSEDGQRWLEIQEDYSLASDPAIPATPCPGPRLTLDSKAAIDDYFAANRTTVDGILAAGYFDHLKELADAYGDRVLIAVNDGLNGLPWVPFETALIAALERPDLVAHAILGQCRQFLLFVQAARACGAHAYIFSEGFGGSLGQISPRLEEQVQADAKRWFYAEVRHLGLLPIGYWLGDVRPHLRWLNTLDLAGLLIEEDKKGFALDPVAIRRQLDPRICLFGNLDSTLLYRGSPVAIRAAVQRQLRAAAEGPFVLANGSPIVIGTPPGNLDAYLQAAGRGTVGGEPL